jgi:hypothetical protein
MTSYITANLGTVAEMWESMSASERKLTFAIFSEFEYDAANYAEFWQLPISVKRALYDRMAGK